jgi:hypothetical protein
MAEALKVNASLLHLSLASNNKKLKKQTKKKILKCFADNGIGDNGAKAIAEVLKVKGNTVVLQQLNLKCMHTLLL